MVKLMEGKDNNEKRLSQDFPQSGSDSPYGKKGPGRSFHYEIAGDFPLFYSILAFGDDLICV